MLVILLRKLLACECVGCGSGVKILPALKSGFAFAYKGGLADNALLFLRALFCILPSLALHQVALVYAGLLHSWLAVLARKLKFCVFCETFRIFCHVYLDHRPGAVEYPRG